MIANGSIPGVKGKFFEMMNHFFSVKSLRGNIKESPEQILFSANERRGTYSTKCPGEICKFIEEIWQINSKKLPA